MAQNFSFPQSGDKNDAEHFAAMIGQSNLTDFVETGFVMSPNYSASPPNVSLTTGAAFISTTNETADSSGDTILKLGRYVQAPGQTVTLTASSMNYVYLEGNLTLADDSPTINAYTSTQSGDDILLIGTVDTSANETIELNRKAALDARLISLADDDPITFGDSGDFEIDYDSASSSLSVSLSSGTEVASLDTGGKFRAENGFFAPSDSLSAFAGIQLQDDGTKTINFNATNGRIRVNNEIMFNFFSGLDRIDFDSNDVTGINSWIGDLTVTGNIVGTGTSAKTVNLNENYSLVNTSYMTFGRGLGLHDSSPNTSNNAIYNTGNSGGSYPFTSFENLVIQGRLAKGDVVIMNDNGAGSLVPFLSATYGSGVRIWRPLEVNNDIDLDENNLTNVNNITHDDVHGVLGIDFGASTTALRINSNSGTKLFGVLSTGEVEVPAGNLNMSGNRLFTDSIEFDDGDASGAEFVVTEDDTDGELEFRYSGTPVMRISNTAVNATRVGLLDGPLDVATYQLEGNATEFRILETGSEVFAVDGNGDIIIDGVDFRGSTHNITIDGSDNLLFEYAGGSLFGISNSGIAFNPSGGGIPVQGIDSSSDIDFNRNEAIKFRLENRTSDPGTYFAGEMWYRSDLD